MKNVTAIDDKTVGTAVWQRSAPGTALAQHTPIVKIRFTSSLTSEDENLVAPAVLKALSHILDLLPIAYTLRIETSDSHIYQHSRPTMDRTAPEPGMKAVVAFDS